MRRTIALALMTLMLVAAAGAANVVVPVLELATDGSWDPALNSLVLRTRFISELVFQGGSKFAASLRLSLLAANLEQALSSGDASFSLPWDQTDVDALNAAPFVGVRSVSLGFPTIFGLPVSTLYFVGDLDALASGGDYPELFGRKDPSSSMHGYLALPDGIIGYPSRWYDGVHLIEGTGVRLGVRALDGAFAAYLYGYHDESFVYITPGIWSADVRAILALGGVELEAFAGWSAAYGPLGAFRGGLLFHYDSGSAGEFYVQAGLPRLNPEVPFSADDLYLLFEPRVNFGFGSIILTLFRHPAVYLNRETREGGMMDAAFDLRFGGSGDGAPRGGARTVFTYDPGYESTVPARVRPNSFSAVLTPYLDFTSGGVGWSLRLPIRVLPFDGPWYSMFEPMIAASASF